MTIQKLPLAERLQRMESGYPAHIEYNASAIQAMAHTPISTYLHDYELERARLMELIRPWGATDDMTYQETAAFLRDLRCTMHPCPVPRNYVYHLRSQAAFSVVPC